MQLLCTIFLVVAVSELESKCHLLVIQKTAIEKDDSEEIGEQVQLVGGDLPVSTPTECAKAIKSKACNTFKIKVNHIGSETESVVAMLWDPGGCSGIGLGTSRIPRRGDCHGLVDSCHVGPGVAEAVQWGRLLREASTKGAQASG